MKKVLGVLGVRLVLSFPLAAQEEEPERRDPLGTRLVNVATPFPVQAKTLEVVFLHRFHLPVQDGSSSDLWGLDSGADVGIGLAFGITSRLDASLLRWAILAGCWFAIGCPRPMAASWNARASC